MSAAYGTEPFKEGGSLHRGSPSLITPNTHETPHPPHLPALALYHG